MKQRDYETWNREHHLKESKTEKDATRKQAIEDPIFVDVLKRLSQELDWISHNPNPPIPTIIEYNDAPENFVVSSSWRYPVQAKTALVSSWEGYKAMTPEEMEAYKKEQEDKWEDCPTCCTECKDCKGLGFRMRAKE